MDKNRLAIHLTSKKSEIKTTTYSGQRGEACQEDPEPYYTSTYYLYLVLCLLIHLRTKLIMSPMWYKLSARGKSDAIILKSEK